MRQNRSQLTKYLKSVLEVNKRTLSNGKYVYVTNAGSDNVSVIRTSDNTVVATIPVGDCPFGVAALPNGNYLYVANFLSHNVSVIGRR
ncbi:MAG: beta-propeller fold lactonase family protein [candidate division WOR-3 bacterium]